MSDLGDDANKVLTEQDPNEANGTPNGKHPDPAPGSSSTGELATRLEISEPERLTRAPEDVAVLHAAKGEPGTLPPTWCRHCAAMVKPEGKGVCPRCGRFLRQNFLARKHPVNRLRRQQLHEQLIAEYTPHTMLQRWQCEMFAGVLEQVENTRPGSSEYKRLCELSQSLGVPLEEAREKYTRMRGFSKALGQEPTTPAPSLTPAETDFLAALRNPASPDTDERIQQVSAVLRQLLTARDEHTVERDPVPAPPVESDPPPSEAIEVPEPATDTEGGVEPPTTDGAPVSELPVTAAAPPEPEPTSPPEPRYEYCKQTIERCAEIKEQHPDAFAALHHDDPDEVERRQEEATAIMMRQVGRGLPRWYR
jgi:hypothetical protein